MNKSRAAWWNRTLFTIEIRIAVTIAKIRVGTHAQSQRINTLASRCFRLVRPAISQRNF